jgi:hypothetical protein
MVLAPPPSEESLWHKYETSIRDFIAELDRNAKVEHDAQVVGRLSCTPRQIDVWVTGSLGGFEISMAIECKRHNRPIDIMTIDGFVGKILDIGADRGVIYSHSGFTESAGVRAKNARSPAVMAVAFAEPVVARNFAGNRGHVSIAPVFLGDIDKVIIHQFLKTGNW